jgi:hypothetical protein
MNCEIDSRIRSECVTRHRHETTTSISLGELDDGFGIQNLKTDQGQTRELSHNIEIYNIFTEKKAKNNYYHTPTRRILDVIQNEQHKTLVQNKKRKLHCFSTIASSIRKLHQAI